MFYFYKNRQIFLQNLTDTNKDLRFGLGLLILISISNLNPDPLYFYWEPKHLYIYL